MPRYAPNKMPAAVKRRYFELIRTGLSGSQAAKRVGVSLSCGSLWFIDAGRVSFIETPISPRYLSQDDRIEILTGSSAVSRSSRSRPDREELPERVPGDRPQPANPTAATSPGSRTTRPASGASGPRPRQLSIDAELREVVAGKLAKHWSPAQISRWLRRRYRRRPAWHACTETLYEAGRFLGVVVNLGCFWQVPSSHELCWCAVGEA
jgi:transposase, IS30 family